MPGVRAVVQFPRPDAGLIRNRQFSGGVAVVADSWWRAKTALDALPIEWEYPPYTHLNTENMQRALIDAMKELSTHIAFLERRLAVTEAKFEHLGHLDSAMQTLSTRLNLLVSDQFSLRVKREFDQILADLVQRASGGESPTGTKTQDDELGRP